MAQRRMFSKSITNSSQFLMMPQSSQNLYFHLGMNADDDGFCEHFAIMRMTESKPDDLKVLNSKGFVKVFDEKVLVIVDWRENNYLRSDRYSPSKYLEIYQDELKKLSSGIPSGNQPATQVRLGKDSIGNKYIAPAAPFVLKEQIKKLEDNKRRDLNIIALYLDKKKPDIRSMPQLQAALKRHLRAAKALSPFNDDQILKACTTAEKEYPKMWTIETLVKILTK